MNASAASRSIRGRDRRLDVFDRLGAVHHLIGAMLTGQEDFDADALESAGLSLHRADQAVRVTAWESRP